MKNAALLALVAAVCFASDGLVFPVHAESLMYPPLAIRAGIQGTVFLDCTISNDGNVVNVVVKSGPSLLARAATENAMKWKFLVNDRADRTDASIRQAHLVYEFKLSGVTHGKPESVTSFDPPSHIVVTAPRPMLAMDAG